MTFNEIYDMLRSEKADKGLTKIDITGGVVIVWSDNQWVSQWNGCYHAMTTLDSGFRAFTSLLEAVRYAVLTS